MCAQQKVAARFKPVTYDDKCFFFVRINMMFGQLCICYVLVERSFTKLLITTNKKHIYLQFWRQAKAK